MPRRGYVRPWLPGGSTSAGPSRLSTSRRSRVPVTLSRSRSGRWLALRSRASVDHERAQERLLL